jgi:hypothetical protein
MFHVLLAVLMFGVVCSQPAIVSLCMCVRTWRCEEEDLMQRCSNVSHCCLVLKFVGDLNLKECSVITYELQVRASDFVTVPFVPCNLQSYTLCFLKHLPDKC